MKRSRKAERRVLSVEKLEQRDLFSGDSTAFLGVGSLTYSFAPDGTHVGKQVSQLKGKFDKLAPTEQWQQAFDRAFQKWSEVSNINFGRVADNGAASGVYGPTRGDERFGDIRITGFDFATDTSAEAVTEETRSVGTWAGDMLFNTATDWRDTGRIEAAALHEIGHILGLGHSTVPASPMFLHGPSGALQLTPQDKANLQAIHGPRSPDSNEGSNGNDSISRASRVKGGEEDTTVLEGFRGDQVWIQFGDLSTTNDRDVYEIRTAIGFTGPMSVEVRTAGLSLAKLSAEITDRNGVVLASSLDPAPVNGVWVLKLQQTTADTKYYLHVHSGTDPFWATGDYSVTIASPSELSISGESIVEYTRNAHRWYYDSHRLKVGFSWQVAIGRNGQPESNDRHSDDSVNSSTDMPVVLTTQTRTVYRVVGTVSDLTDIDVYRVVSPNGLNGHNEMVISLESLGRGGLVPNIEMLDDRGALLHPLVRVRGYGQTELVLSNVQSNQRYFVKLSAASVNDEFRTGSFVLHVTFAAPSTPPQDLAVGIISNNNRTVEREWYIARPQLFGLSLVGNSTTVSVGQIVVSLFDKNRNLVIGLVAPLNELRSAPGVFLDAGTYYFQISATFAQGTIPDIAFRFTAETPSQPIGPLLGPVNVQPLFLCPGSTSVYCYPNSTAPTPVPQQVGPTPVVPLPPPTTITPVASRDQWFWTNNFLPTNPTNPLDVDGDGQVSPLDVLVVINAINTLGVGPVPTPPQFLGHLDTNANGAVDPLDVLILINALNRTI